MARTRTFNTDEAVRAARDLFWERGYEATSLADLEDATGLGRSSLYQAFGSKRGLYDAAVEHYLRHVIAPLIAPLEAPGATRQDVAEYFRTLSERLSRQLGLGVGRGCLILQTTSELAVRDAAAREVGRTYRERLLAAFIHALTPPRGAGTDAARATRERRGQLLVGAVTAILVTTRIDLKAALALCQATLAEVDAWA
ncbi:TetR/AcrR family transcriptional regulator [Myxococcaceae bacterium JPH2]|nr:TetR/AcrR family transcriptional regulator [Myxococcaceae bacterium JPH2]